MNSQSNGMAFDKYIDTTPPSTRGIQISKITNINANDYNISDANDAHKFMLSCHGQKPIWDCYTVKRRLFYSTWSTFSNANKVLPQVLNQSGTLNLWLMCARYMSLVFSQEHFRNLPFSTFVVHYSSCLIRTKQIISLSILIGTYIGIIDTVKNWKMPLFYLFFLRNLFESIICFSASNFDVVLRKTK